MKTKRTNKLLVLVISLMMIVTLLAGLSITANAEETGTETNTPVAEFVGQQVNLGGDISMKFYVRNNEDRPIESITVEVEFLGKLTYITECEKHPTDAKVYIYTFEGINPQCLGDLMNVTILWGGIPVGHEKAMLTGYSVEKNLNEIYDDCTEAQKQLIDDLRAYGKASEVYTGHTSMTGTNYPVREVAIPATSITTTDTADDVNLHAVNVRFGTMNYLMFKFEFASGTPTDIGDKVKIDGEAPADAYIDGNYYVVISKPISPENFHKDVSLVYDESKLTLSYSINDYCRTVVDGEYTEEMKSLAKALYNYGLSAHIVEGNHEGGTATCAAQKVCTICGNSYGNLLDHNYTYTANDDANTITESCDKGCGHNKTITLKAPENAVYNGNAHQASVEGAIDAEYDLTYNANPVGAGTYTATLTAGGKSVSLDFEITMATPNVTAPTANTLTYNGEAQELVSAGYTDFGTMLYSLTEDGEYTTSIPQGTNAGDYTVWYYVQGNENANDSAVASVTVEIAKAVASITAAPTPNTLTYIGEAEYLINAGEANVGTMVYSLTEDGEYTTSIPQGTNAGDYTVWYYVQGDANHNDSAKDTVSVNIAKAPVTITLDPKTKEYGEGDPMPTYTVEGLIGDDTLGFFFSRESIEDVGVHPYKLNMSSNPGDENYTINYVGASITIVPKELNMEDLYIEMDPESFVYDGTEKKPVSLSIYDLRVSYVDQKLVEGKDYEVTGYHNNVNPGTATITIQGIGNFTGTATITFTITCDHSYNEDKYTNNGDGTHDKVCSVCGYVLADNEPHTLTYTANGNIITESCSVGCGYSETATIIARDATYDGLVHNTAIVNYSEGWKGGELTISYANNTNAGTATASITVGEVTATVDFIIAKAPLTVTADAKIKSYGDENPTLTYTAEGLLGGDTLTGTLTGALSREEGENVGSYAITLGTLSADNYTISFEGADFTIQAKEVTEPIVTLDQTSYQYDGNVKEPKVVSIVVDGRTLTEGIDYTVSYEDNVYVNTEAKVVINFMGNYDGTFKKYFTITQDPKTTEFDGEWVTVPKE